MIIVYYQFKDIVFDYDCDLNEDRIAFYSKQLLTSGTVSWDYIVCVMSVCIYWCLIC